MATQPINTAKGYALTAAGACYVTLRQGEKAITWEALSEGGQTSFIVPAGATVEISDSSALLSPLPANFKAALGDGDHRIGGERITSATIDGDGICHLRMRHATWATLATNVSACRLTPNSGSDKALSQTLMLTPTNDMSTGWLKVPANVSLVWLYGEPVILRGHTYIIGLTQIAPDIILTNLLATF